MPIDPRIPMGVQAPQFLNPMDVRQKSQQIHAQDQQMQEAQAKSGRDQFAREVWSADETNWGDMVNKWRQAGVPNADKLPDVYYKGLHDRLKFQVQEPEKQQAQSNFEAELAARAEDRKASRDQAYALAKIAAGEKYNPAKKEFDMLPPENQKQIETIANKNGTVTSVKNELDAAISQLDNPELSETQRIKVGEGILKTLNSAQGADAVGVEEAQRLGSLLQMKMFNFTQAGSMFGRDLPDFVSQVKNTSEKLGSTLSANKQTIDSLYGRQAASNDNSGKRKLQVNMQGGQNGVAVNVPGVSSASAAPPPIKHGQEMDGYVFLGGDPSKKENWKKK